MLNTKFSTVDFSEAAEGVIAGYASRFGEVDSYNDIVVKGAFKKSLKARKPLMLWMHDQAKPIGVWTKLEEDDVGLRVEGKITTASAAGRDAFELMKDGALSGLSIGFLTVRFGRGEGGVRLLQEIDLREISLVTMPALDSARVDGVKADGDDSMRALAEHMQAVQAREWMRYKLRG